MPSKLSVFEQEASRIIWEWSRRKRAHQDSAESPNAWFKREAYAFLRPFVLARDERTLERIVRRDQRPNALVEEAIKNPFKLGLLAMCVDESISRSDRSVFGNQMLYAHLHDVPPEFLNGFITASGKPSIIASKLKAGAIEPGFEARVRRFRAKRPR
jgi:hypothetical protein